MMISILKISINQAQAKSNKPSSGKIPFANIIEFLIIPKQQIDGPEIIEVSSNKFMLAIPVEWADLREKELAALRRTIASAAIEIGEKIKPSIVYVIDIDLCGLAGIIVAKSLGCPLAIGLRADDIEESLFNERKVAILDTCINTANAIIVVGEKEAELLRVYYPLLNTQIKATKGFSVDIPEVASILSNLLQEQPDVPWRRQSTKPLLVSRPQLAGKEITYIDEVLRSGWWGYGPVAKYLEELFVQSCGIGTHALAVSSCTAALHLSLSAVGIGPGDEVIVPALTFVSTAAAVVHAGATPIFADVDPLTLSISPDDVERKFSIRTKAVIPVHFAGVPADIHSIEQILNGRAIIIEDAAHAIGAEVNGHKIGSLSPFTCFSFAPTKQMPSCFGGILVYKDDSLTLRLRELSDVGLRIDTHNRSIGTGAGPANEVVSIGYRYRMNDVAAALAVAQFQQLEYLIARRSSLVERYYYNLAQTCCDLITVPKATKPSWYIMPIRVPMSMRERLRDYLAIKGIDTSIHYPSLTDQPIFKNINELTPIASQESKRLISLPLHLGMSNADVDRICSVVIDFILNNYKEI